MAAELAPPRFLPLAADPLRWRLMRELARSDRRVRELCVLVGRPQNLVSYHLGRLRDAGVVSSRRSAADGRDAYYRLDLERFRELMAASAGALHPALQLTAPPPREWAPPADRARILFLCTGNSARSPMAEALAGHLTDGAVRARSAGSRPKPLHPNAVRAMRERGIDIAGRRPTHLDELAGARFDAVVTLCDRVREVCPEFAGGPEAIHWSIPDPSSEGATDRETYPAFERTAAELAARIPFLLELIAPAHPPRRRT